MSSELTAALTQLLEPRIVGFLTAGVGLGMLFGALPGLTATMGIALLVPLTFWLPTDQGLAMLLGIYCGAIPAGGIPAILLNVPGTPASIAATWDGYALSQKGRADLALKINVFASLFGQLLGVLFLALAAFPIASLALRMGPAEYFGLGVFGLSLMAGVSGKRVWEGVLAGTLGLALATVGLDPLTAYPRFTFGLPELLDGVAFVPVMIGLFGLGEVLAAISAGVTPFGATTHRSADAPALQRCVGPVLGSSLLGSLIGVFVGAVPAAGGDIAAIIAWDQSRRLSPNREEFGQGSTRGLAAACAAANAVIGGAMTTMMTLGIPGDAPSAVLIGALLIHGVQPGPLMFRDHRTLVWTIVLLLALAALVTASVGLLGSAPLARLARVPAPYLWMAVVLLSITGAYALNNSLTDVWLMFIAGLAGFVLRKLEVPLGPLVLGLILGPMIESNLRRALVLSRGDWSTIFARPLVLVFLVAAAAALFGPVAALRRAQHNRPAALSR